jgi:GNAT superfamily N-acetyltransferase
LNSAAFQFTPDAWLTTILQIQSFRVSTTSIEEYLTWKQHAHLETPYFVTIKTDSEDLLKEEYLDGQLTYIQKMNQYSSTSKPIHYPYNGYEVRFSTNIEKNSILAIGQNAFELSRFHKDKRFTRQMAERIKNQWLLSNLTMRENCETLVLLNLRGEAIGFCCILRYIDQLVIDLITVSPKFRGMGLGKLLVSHSQALSYEVGLPLNVGTQSENTANSFYRSMGFKFVNSLNVWHHIRQESS